MRVELDALFEKARQGVVDPWVLVEYVRTISAARWDEQTGVLLPSEARTACTKCKGEGLVPRDGIEADQDIHPILSQKKTICDRCGGSTYEPQPEPRAK